MKKKIIIIVIAILIVAAGYYIRLRIIKYQADKNKTAQEKFVDDMREKYDEINSLDEFNEGIKYVAYPNIFGYDLRLLKEKKPNLLSLITLDELKFLYETAKVGTGQRGNDNDMKFLDIMHKIY
jgi:hypothetical protein